MAYMTTLLRKTSDTLELAFIITYFILQNSIDAVSKLQICVVDKESTCIFTVLLFSHSISTLEVAN